MEEKFVSHILQRNFQKFADKPFLIDAQTKRVLRYSEFEALVSYAKETLSEKGLVPGDRVGLCSPNSIEFASFFFACLVSELTVVPIHPLHHSKEIKSILSIAKCKLVVLSGANAELQSNFEPEEVLFLRTPFELPAFHSKEMDYTHVKDNFPAVIAFTSGTTSEPKGVVHFLKSFFWNASVFNETMKFGVQTRVMNIWPMAFPTGYFNNLLCPFVAGGSVVIGKMFDAQTALNFWKPVIENEVNTLWLSPSMCAALVKIDRDPAGLKFCREKINRICVGTAPLYPVVKSEFERKYGQELFESYGLSELLLIAGNNPTNIRKVKTVGKPLSGVNISIREGEIYVQSPSLMQGYLDPTTNNIHELARDQWFATGDLGELDADGNLLITGRKKDLIIRGGLNISPRLIEEVVLQHPAVEQVAVVGIPHAEFGEEIIAVVQLKKGLVLKTEEKTIFDWCRQNLSRSALPGKFRQVDQCPTGPTGKILKAKVKEQLMQSDASLLDRVVKLERVC